MWTIPLDLSGAQTARSAAFLSAEERTRAQSFRSALHRDRFTVAHGALREILATRLGQDPVKLELLSGADDKPRIRRRPGVADLRFSLSHSDGLALVAVVRGREVGVDLERIDARTEVSKLARRFFAPEEVAAFDALDPADRRHGFFRCWTRKEAYLKALGTGLHLPLDRFAVTLEAGQPARLLRAAAGDSSSWTMHSFEPAAGYVAAVVVEGSLGAVVECSWERHGANPLPA
jgi:4'-phosphopantetheinyl transferase